MATTLNQNSVSVSILSEIKNAGVLSPGALDRFEKTYAKALTDGTGADQAKNHWHSQRTLAASASESLDLAGGLTNLVGDVLIFTKIKYIFLFAAAANTNDVVIGNAAANAWVGPFGAAAHTLAIKPGGHLSLEAPDGNGYAVTAGTGDILKVLNGGAGTGVTYDIILVGTV